MVRTCLITGGGTGIGAAVAEALAGPDVAVAVNYRRSQEAAMETVDAVESAGGAGVAIQADVTDPGEVRAMVDQVHDEFGPIDVLVNNAGLSDNGPIATMSRAQWHRVLSTCLDGTYTVTRACFDDLRAADTGRLITVSSIAASQPEAAQANYAAAKAGIEGFTRAASRELGRTGTTANCVAPGYTRTAMTADWSEDEQATRAAETDLGRFATPEEIAGVVAFLASDDASYVTGAVVPVDGGIDH